MSVVSDIDLRHVFQVYLTLRLNMYGLLQDAYVADIFM